MERTLDLHAKIAEASAENKDRIERQLFQDKEFPGVHQPTHPGRRQPHEAGHST